MSRLLFLATLFLTIVAAGRCAARSPRSRCAWRPHHQNTLTESTTGSFFCRMEAKQCR